MKKQNMFITIVLLSFFFAGLLSNSMEVIAIVLMTIILTVFGIGVKNEIVKLRKEVQENKKLS